MDNQNPQTPSDDIPFEGGTVLVDLIRTGKHGPKVVRRQRTHNLIVNTGKRQLWRVATGLSTSVYRFMRIGTSAVAAASGQTNVITPVTGTLKTVDTRSLLSGTRTMQWVISYPSGAGTKSATNIREAVLMNQRTSPGGSAMMRIVFTAVNKTTADKFRLTYRARLT